MSLKKHYQDGEKQKECRSKQQFEGCNKGRQDDDFSQGKNPTGRLEKTEYVPPLREDVVKKVHEVSNLGETKGLNLLWQNYWWSRCSSAMKKAVRKCYECQIVTKQHNTEPMKPGMLPESPFQRVAFDFKVHFMMVTTRWYL